MLVNIGSLQQHNISWGNRLLVAVWALTGWTMAAEVAVVDRRRPGRIARSSHGTLVLSG
jgi:hypothetical protein